MPIFQNLFLYPSHVKVHRYLILLNSVYLNILLTFQPIWVTIKYVVFRFFKSNLFTNPSDDASEQRFFKETTEGNLTTEGNVTTEGNLTPFDTLVNKISYTKYSYYINS